jgi:hypothetical protein
MPIHYSMYTSVSTNLSLKTNDIINERSWNKLVGNSQLKSAHPISIFSRSYTTNLFDSTKSAIEIYWCEDMI